MRLACGHGLQLSLWVVIVVAVATVVCFQAVVTNAQQRKQQRDCRHAEDARLELHAQPETKATVLRRQHIAQRHAVRLGEARLLWVGALHVAEPLLVPAEPGKGKR